MRKALFTISIVLLIVAAQAQTSIKVHSNGQISLQSSTTLSQTTQLTKTVENFFPNLYSTLKTQYVALDRKEWLHCCLYMLQLDKMSICVLLQEPYYSCRRCILKLEKAFDCRQGLSAFIIEQAKSC